MIQGLRSMPIMTASNMAESISYYTEGLGFELAGVWHNDDGSEKFAILQMDLITIGLTASDKAPADTSWAAYLYLADIAAYADQIQGKGIDIGRGPEDSFYFCRELEVTDPSGNKLCFAQDLRPPDDGPGL